MKASLTIPILVAVAATLSTHGEGVAATKATTKAVPLSKVETCDSRRDVSCPVTRLPGPSDASMQAGAFWSCREGKSSRVCDLQIVTCGEGECFQSHAYCDDIFGIPCAYTSNVPHPDAVPLSISTHWSCFDWNDHEFCRLKIVVCDDEDPGFCTEL